MAIFPYAGFLDGTPYPVIPMGTSTVNVSSASQLTSALNNASPGQRIVLANGTYSGFTVSGKNGSSSAGISIEAANTGGVVFGSGSTITINNSAYVTLKGLSFPYELGSGNLTQFRGSSHHCRISRCLFGPASIGSPGANKSPFIYLGNDVQHIRIDHCELRNKANPGNAILGDGNFDTNQTVRYIRIDHNYIHDIRPEVDNEKEPIRLGVSTMSKTFSNSVVERNIFAGCIAEPEIVSMKACGIRVSGNVFLRSIGGPVYRHGEGGVMTDNYVIDRQQTFGSTIGSGGFRFYDRNHDVSYNYIDGVYGGNFQGPLLLDTGDAEGSSSNLAGHWRVVNAMVEKNVIIDCPEGLRIGDNYSSAPTGCTIRDNLVVRVGTGQAVTQRIAPVNSTLSNNTYAATPSAAGMTQDSAGVWRKAGVGPRLTYLQPGDVGVNGDPNDSDGTGALVSGGGGPGPGPDPDPDPEVEQGFVATGSPASGASTTVPVPAPTGVRAGDFQLAVITCSADETIAAVPAGWQLLDKPVVTSPTSPNRGGPMLASAYYSTSGATGSVSWTKSGTGFWHAVRSAWRGVVLAQHTAVARPSGTSQATPPVSPTKPNSIVVGVVAADLPNTPAGPYTPPGGWTERYDQTRTSGADNLSITIADTFASPTPDPDPVSPVRYISVSPGGGLGQFNMSDNDYICGFRFELPQARTIDRWYFSVNGEGATCVSGRTGYGAGNGGTWFGRIVTVNQATGLPTSTVLASESVNGCTAHSRAISEFGLSTTHQSHWVQFSPITIQPNTMYAFLLSNTHSSPGSGGSASTGNHMSPNLNFAELDDMGPNGENTLDPQAPGAMYGYSPRETTMWSPDGGSTWRFGDQVGWYQLGSGRGRMWVVGYRISGGNGVAHGWPYMNWPSDTTSGITVTFTNIPSAVTITQAGGCNDGSANIGVITVRNTTTGQQSTTSSLGSGRQVGTLASPVTVAAGESYRISASGRVSMGSPTSGQGAAFGLGSRAPWRYTLSTGNQMPMLFVLPHAWPFD